MSAHFRGHLGGFTVTRLRAALITDSSDNTEYRDWAHAVSTVLTNCDVQPFLLSSRLSVEVDIAREYSGTLYRVWIDPKYDVVYTDRIIWDGDTFDVQAQPSKWGYADGTRAHSNFLMKLREG